MEQIPVKRYWCHQCLSAIYLEQVLVSPLTLRCPNCGERLGEVTDGSVVWIERISDKSTPAQTMIAEQTQLLRQVQVGDLDWEQATELLFNAIGEYLQAAHIPPQVLDTAVQEFVRRMRTLREKLVDDIEKGDMTHDDA